MTPETDTTQSKYLPVSLDNTLRIYDDIPVKRSSLDAAKHHISMSTNRQCGTIQPMAFLLYLMLSDSYHGNIKTYPSLTFLIFILICFHLNWRDKEKESDKCHTDKYIYVVRQEISQH